MIDRIKSDIAPSAFALIIGCAGLAFAAPAAAQVRYFDKPPTLAELRASLSTDASRTRGLSRPGSVRSRSIQWSADKSLADATPRPQAPVAKQSSGARDDAPAVAVPLEFELGSSAVRGDSLPFIRTVADLLREDRELSLVVEGHTDSSGGYRNNMVLSWQRALSVYTVLVERFGIDPARLRPVGFGPTRPLGGESAAAPVNRRVQFRVKG
ncbi:MAG: OmpA family protein [Burkholderiaceae bacterium]